MVITSNTQLYLITPPKINLKNFPDILAKTLDAGPVACLQLRVKNASEGIIRRYIDALKPVTQARGVAFILNDNPILAADTGCDGVHIGQQDLAYEDAREAVGTNSVVGVTCHNSRHLAMEAAEKGADYVAFGAFFESKTKKPKTQADIEILQWWCQDMIVPAVAIGGITLNNCKPIITARADFLAVIESVWAHPDGPHEAVKRFNKLIKETSHD